MYGLDADLIFLCLSTNSDNMFLLRESNEMDKNKNKDTFNYISIDIMKELIVDTILIDIDKKLIDPNNIINDFIFLCYLLGNDFLPHIPALNIYTNGLDIILNKYIKLLSINNYKSFIINKNVTINTKMFIDMISMLSSEESDILKNEYNIKRKFYKCKSTDPYDIEVHRIENLQFKINDPIMLGSDKSSEWKKRYYKYYFNINDSMIEDFSYKMVEEYMNGLLWVTKYYFDKCPSWTWYYPYDYPPFLEDMLLFLEKNKTFDFNNIKFEYGSPLKPFNQLMLVLPPQSSYLIPKELSHIVHNKKSLISYMYPINIKQDFIGKNKHWMGIPNLPCIDLELVKSVYNTYEKQIPSDIMNRNKKLDILKF